MKMNNELHTNINLGIEQDIYFLLISKSFYMT